MVLFKTLGGSGPPDFHLRHAHAIGSEPYENGFGSKSIGKF